MSEIKKTDANGNVIYTLDDDGENFHKYDEKGREIYCYYSDGSGSFREYDENGRLSQRIRFDLAVPTYDGSGEWSSKAYEYDDNGSLLGERYVTVPYSSYRERIKAYNAEIKAQIEQRQQSQQTLNKARQAIVDRVLSRLDEGAMPWDNGMQGVSVRPYNAITGKPYRGMNVLSLMLTFKSDPRWITFNQATEAGYAVKKGARGVPIELYKTIDKRTGKDADIAAIKEEIKDMTFEERQAFKKENLRSFAKSYYVFNASDVHGIEPYVPKELTPTDISARNERIERVIANSQAPIYYDGKGQNYYIPTADEIHLTDRSAFKSDEFFYNTALHEMAHSTGHSSRLNRPGGAFGSKAYAREELVAEISSVLTAAEFGLNHSDRVIENSAEYVRSWAEDIRENPQTLIDAVFDASRATDYICDSEHKREQVKENTQKESLQSSVKEWYSRTFSTDELASTLNEKTTFDDVRRTILDGKDIYATLGGWADSVVRERVFHELADILGISYGAIYNDWLDNTEMPETRLERYTRNSNQKETEAASKTAPTEQKHTKPLMINFYAGPSAGKSVAALELTAALKKAGYNVEYVSEYAKELVLEGRTSELNDQKHVTDEQYKRFTRIRNSADIIVTDSPVLLGLVYGEGKISDEYKKQIRGYYDTFDNFNMLITRPKDATFQTEGRVHDEKQSLELDGKIKAMLDAQGVFYGSYKRDDIAKTVERIGQTYSRLYGEQKERTQKENAASTPLAPPKKPYEFKTNLDNIPDAMKALPNWVAFRTHWVFDKKKQEWKLKKDLITPNQPRPVSSSDYLKWASPTDPSTWATFDKAVALAKRYKLEGLSFAMSGSGMTCIDLDKHLDENGKPSEHAKKYIAAAENTYIEKSVSGRGLHIFYAGERPNGYQNRNIQLELETYDSARFISMTGNLYDNAPKEVMPPSAELTNLLKSNLSKLQQYSAPSAPLGMGDNELIEKIRASKRGNEFEALWRGEDVCGDHSVSDFKLCNMLAFFSGGDVGQVERCFRTSGLYRPQKGDAYVKRTAEKACATLIKTYSPPKPNNTKKNSGRPSGSGGNGGNGSSGRGSSGR